jgi:hypothetical protein
MTPCSIVGGNQRFGGTYRLHLLHMHVHTTQCHNPQYHNRNSSRSIFCRRYHSFMVLEYWLHCDTCRSQPGLALAPTPHGPPAFRHLKANRTNPASDRHILPQNTRVLYRLAKCASTTSLSTPPALHPKQDGQLILLHTTFEIYTETSESAPPSPVFF